MGKQTTISIRLLLAAQSSQIFRLGSGRPAIAAFTIGKLVVSMIGVTIGSID
jgi:hypothetical protein